MLDATTLALIFCQIYEMPPISRSIVDQGRIENTDDQTEEVNKLFRGCDAPRDDLSFFSDKRTKGSCEWTFHQKTISSFFTDNGPYPRVLWCFGSPGSGKSVTTTYIIERLTEEKKPCAYYYFRAGNQIKNRLDQFLTSIAFQLSKHIPEYKRKLCSLAEDRFDISNAGHKLLWKNLFFLALLQCNPRVCFYVVIDGLDELGQAKELLQKMLVELGDASIRLRLLLVSRPTFDIESSIERLSERMYVRRLALGCNAEDLEMYVRKELDVMTGDYNFKKATLRDVVAKANGSFLWAHLVVREILDCQTEAQVENALTQVPRELEPLYERIDTHLADMFRSRPQDRDMGHTIIVWIMCAKRPLHLDEIKTILEYDFPEIVDMRQTVQKLCQEFVHVDKKSYVSAVHASAREFLMSNPTLNYHVNAAKANQTLFSKCIEALAIARYDHDAPIDSGRAFMEYAASSWPFHLLQSTYEGDAGSLTTLMKLFGKPLVLDWMFMLARASNLRAMVEASQALSEFLNTMDLADQEPKPLMRRIGDKETIYLWALDLIRIVGKFGSQITQQPMTVYNLMPAFCPKESILYRLFGPGSSFSVLKEGLPLTIRANISPVWDDCFAKFPISAVCSPDLILSLDRYFAVLTKMDGIVHLYYSITCEIARQLHHGEIIWQLCVDPAVTRIATYGSRKTMVWDIESGRLLFSIENPPYTRAVAMSFQRSTRGEDLLLIFSDDSKVRSCSLGSIRVTWDRHGTSLDRDIIYGQQVNSPYSAQFSPDGFYLATSYRGACPSAWFLGDVQPRLIGHCDHLIRMNKGKFHRYAEYPYARAFAWNPVTGHLLGTFHNGMVFKWHPQEDEFSFSELTSMSIKCSADGKLFATGSFNGTLRIWNFHRFTPIYQSHYPLCIQDVDLGRNEARVYDLRDQHCTVWEPDCLLRATESDDLTSDFQISTGNEKSSVDAVAGSVLKGDEGVTAISTRAESPIYANGDGTGQIIISNFDGRTLLKMDDNLESVEALVWSENGKCLASVDLARVVKIWEFGISLDEQEPWKEVTTPLSFDEVDRVLQLHFNTSGEMLMVSTPTAIKVHQIRSITSIPIVVSLEQMSRWVTHPQDENLALGFNADKVTLMAWDHPTTIITLAYESTTDTTEHFDRSLQIQPIPNRLSQMTPASTSEDERSAHKVLVSPNGKLILVEIYGTVKLTPLRLNCLLTETKYMFPTEPRGLVPVCSISPAILEVLCVSLGFISADCLIAPGHRESSAVHSRLASRRKFDLSTFVFVDKDFWVCSVDIGFSQDQAVEIHKHFFLPRDWQNLEWLDMAIVTPSGDFLCPRNGDVAVVSNGFLREFGSQK